MASFIVYALPRSRTAWLARFLTYGEWACGHDEARHLRSVEDVKSWFAQPNTGTAETAAAPFWRTVQDISPDTKVVVVRRPVEDVLESLMRLAPFDRVQLEAHLRRLDHKLDQIEKRVPGALSVSFYDLADEEVCARVFEHCLPYKHDPNWWAAISPINVQINLAASIRYFQAHRPQLEKLAAQVKCLTLAEFARKPLREPDELTIRQEPLETFFRDGQHLFAEHCVKVGEAPDAYNMKNYPLHQAIEANGNLQIITARCNGRMFGYLMTVIAPSFEKVGEQTAVHTTFYASPEFPGLGRHLQSAAHAALRERGVQEVILRAGPRGDGPRMGPIFKRMGAEDHGQLFRLQL